MFTSFCSNLHRTPIQRILDYVNFHFVAILLKDGNILALLNHLVDLHPALLVLLAAMVAMLHVTSIFWKFQIYNVVYSAISYKLLTLKYFQLQGACRHYTYVMAWMDSRDQTHQMLYTSLDVFEIEKRLRKSTLIKKYNKIGLTSHKTNLKIINLIWI